MSLERNGGCFMWDLLALGMKCICCIPDGAKISMADDLITDVHNLSMKSKALCLAAKTLLARLSAGENR